MPGKLVECIPNFSEGRRTEVIKALEETVKTISGVHLLDRHSDEDHNRTVLTFAGPPEAVVEAAYSAIALASERIDLEQHHGEHPRIGATDVVPFVPLRGATMEDCVELAKRLGKRVGDELNIPVYLYERAATRPDRVNLEDIRRGEYELLKQSIGSDPDRKPDYGPPAIGPAGATVIGARPALIAYNVYLTTEEPTIAKDIARAVRHSSGGLRYVKALGMLVEGRAQVSMNLTDYTRTSIARVQEMVRREAERHGVGIHHAELVGLIPQAALVEAAQYYLQLDQFEPDQVLESKLYTAMEQGEGEIESFLERLAAGTPTPGGGAASAYAGAMSAALVAMVARLTVGKQKYREVEPRMKEIISLADEARSSLIELSQLDAEAFEAVMSAYRLPKSSTHEREQREQTIEQAMQQAARIPLQVAQKVVLLMGWAVEVAEQGNVNAASDAGSAAALAQAALQSAALNVRINANSITDRKSAQGWLEQLQTLESQAEEHLASVGQALKARAQL